YGVSFHVASSFGHLGIVKMLSDKGASSSSHLLWDSYGTPLATAASRGYRKVVKYLLEQQVDVTIIERPFENNIQAVTLFGSVEFLKA
ncbi:hypothetical protein BJ875DRAFT_385060, partial [Amylocarpus encephaloides]